MPGQSQVGQRLADRLSAARQRLFVGRTHEQGLFRDLLGAEELPFQLLYIFGPGGIGKTTLLKQFAALCAQAEVPALLVDGRHLEPTPEAFLAAVRTALKGDPTRSPLDALGSCQERLVLLIDTCEQLAPLERWLRESFLLQLSDRVLVVLAGRQPPSAAWRGDPGWQSLIHTIALRNLQPAESCDYLARRDIPPELYTPFLDFTHGHPLALSLFVDTMANRQGGRLIPQETPDVIKILLEQFIQKVPSPSHRTALELCSLVRLANEALLCELVGAEEAHEIFTWLRDLSFIETHPLGLFPHDLAREALIADLRWRNPDRYAELHTRLRAYYAELFPRAPAEQQQRLLQDLLFLHRDNPLLRPFIEWKENGELRVDALREQDVAELVAMVERHEGAQGAASAAYWLRQQPQGAQVVRGAGDTPLGFVLALPLHELEPDQVAGHPDVEAPLAYLRRHAPLRAGEKALYFRFWLARDTYQTVSAIQSLLFVRIVHYYLTTPGLAFTFVPCADAGFWEPGFAYASIQRLPDADFELDGHRHGMFGHDWRIMPPLAWLSVLGEREIALSQPLAPPAKEPLLVLSEPDFAAAIRSALQHMSRPESLRQSLLLRSRLVVERAQPGARTGERVKVLQQVLRDAMESLRALPRHAKYYQALHQTYVEPAGTQEQAAEALDLPFSTYRRHLQSGVKEVTALLWAMETGAAE